MALADKGKAPYAPRTAVMAVINHHRDRTLSTPVTAQGIERLGIEPSLARRTLVALKQLDLLDKAGEPTETFQKIKVATTAEFQSVLQDWLREAYKPVFTYVEPTDDVQRVLDQFRYYEPAAMRPRMATLFLGLCAWAGLIEKVPPLPRVGAAPRRTGATSARAPTDGASPAPVPKRTPRESTPIDHRQEVPSPPAPQPNALDDARQKYVDLLLAKVSEGEVSTDLLDRIERALGIATPERGSTS